MRRVYLDYNASTPIDPAVAAAMGLFLEDHVGNPSSGHWAATAAKGALPNTLDVSFVGRASVEILSERDGVSASRAPPATPGKRRCLPS